MGKIKFGAIVVAISGKIGGTVFSRNRGGAYSKNWVKPLNPQTTKQSVVRAAMASVASAWKGLSADVRAAWDQAASSGEWNWIDRLGDVFSPNGFNLFMRLNQSLASVGFAMSTAAPVKQALTAITVDLTQMILTAGVLTTADLTLSGAGTANERWLISASAPVSPGRTTAPSYKFLQFFPSSFDTPDFTAAYIAEFGSPVAGQKVFIKFQILEQTNGQRSAPIFTDTIVV